MASPRPPPRISPAGRPASPACSRPLHEAGRARTESSSAVARAADRTPRAAARCPRTVRSLAPRTAALAGAISRASPCPQCWSPRGLRPPAVAWTVAPHLLSDRSTTPGCRPNAAVRGPSREVSGHVSSTIFLPLIWLSWTESLRDRDPIVIPPWLMGHTAGCDATVSPRRTTSWTS